MRREPQKQMNSGAVRRERDRRALRRQIVLLACGLVMAGGFVVAVGQHYTAVRYGYESEKLRAERVRLLAERDRLLLELSVAESPVTLEREALRIGMQPARPSQIAARSQAGQPETDETAGRDRDETRKPSGARADAGGARETSRGAGDASAGAGETSTGAGKTVTVAREADAGGRAVAKGRKGSADERARVVRGDTRPRIVEAVGKRGR